MIIKVVNDYDALSLSAAEEVAHLLKTNPRTNLALPTGNSPRGCYKILSQWSKDGIISWAAAKCFALDDYLDIDPQYSFHQLLASELYQNTNLPDHSRFNPLQVENYDQLILEDGGLDLCILGIGENGHIAFNEPPTPLASWTHCVWLSDMTRSANQKYFSEQITIPTRAITVGISTILASRKIILLASGENKKQALVGALNHGADANLPASFLSGHKDLLVIADFDW
jgi:glucosamine-6-phosphate deaminase